MLSRSPAWCAFVLAGCGSGSTDAHLPEFDGREALGLVITQTAFGPRVPGTSSHVEQARWMSELLARLAAELDIDTFTHVTTTGRSLRLTNLRARFGDGPAHRYVVMAHWDTRPTAWLEGARNEIPGANDGGSGTAVVLQLARILAKYPPPRRVDLVLLDGEDYGPGHRDMFLGARRAVSQGWAHAEAASGVLVDLVGERGGSFPKEGYSLEFAPALVHRLWRLAGTHSEGASFSQEEGPHVQHDHLYFNRAGLPTAAVLDPEYGPDNSYWHSPEDTPDKLDAAALEAVGSVIVALIYGEPPPEP